MKIPKQSRPKSALPVTPGIASKTDQNLRQRALQALQQNATGAEYSAEDLPDADPQRLQQELRVHQTELEMQNEHLRRFQAEVEAWHAKYFDLYDLAPVGYCTLNGRGLIQQANHSAASLLGVTRAQMLNRPLSRFVLAQDADSFQSLRKRLHNHTGAQWSELRLVKSDGTPIWVHLSATTMRSEDNTEVLHLALTDISASVQAEELKKAVAKDQTLISAIPDLIFTNQSDGRFLDYKASDPSLLFAPPESFLGRTVQDVLPPGKAKLLMDAFARALATRTVQEVEYTLPIAGKNRCFEARIVPSPPDKLITFLQDITERKQTEEMLRHLAHYDVLTQLPNRCFLHDRLEQALAICKRKRIYGALMFLDLDNFKPLNDAQGHDVGDLLLIEVAHRLKSCVREIDTVGRYGGDEFGVILCELDADPAIATDQAIRVAEKIRSHLSEPYILSVKRDHAGTGSIQHSCSASIGVCLFGYQDSSAQDGFRDADVAMYQAKAAGGNRVHCLGLTA